MDPLELIGSKARLAVLRALSRRDMYVSELMDAVGMDGKTATHHLDRLEEAGILTSRREGRRKYYSLIREVELSVAPSPERKFLLQFRELDEESGVDERGEETVLDDATRVDDCDTQPEHADSTDR